MDVETLIRMRSCEQVVLCFTAHLDQCRFEEAARMLAPHGILCRPGGSNIVGREHLLSWYRARKPQPVVRHFIANLRPRDTGRGKVVVESYFTVYREPAPTERAPGIPQPLSIGRYRDHLLGDAGEWLLERREVEIDFDRG
jgi:hypothetical protein